MPAPAAPANFTLAARSRYGGFSPLDGRGVCGSVKLTWDETGLSPASHELQMRRNAGAWFACDPVAGVSGQCGSGGTLADGSAEVLNIKNGIPAVDSEDTIDFRIRVLNVSGASDWSDTVTFDTPFTLVVTETQQFNSPQSSDLSVPSGVTLLDNGAFIRIGWTDSQQHEKRFEVEVVEVESGLLVANPSHARFGSEVTLRANSHHGWDGVWFNLRYETEYFFRVRAECYYGVPGGIGQPPQYSEWSSPLSFTVADQPVQLVGLPATVEAWVGYPFSYSVQTSATPDDITTGTLPGWLALDGDELEGTPVAVGEISIAITAENATGSDTDSLTITISEPGVSAEFAAPAALPWMTATEALEAGLTTAPLGTAFAVRVRGKAIGPVSEDYTITLVSPPGWLSLVDGIISGTAPAVGVTVLTVHVDNGTEEADVELSFVASEPSGIVVVGDGDSVPTIEGWLNERLLSLALYTGECTVEQWFLNGAPPGVELMAASCEGGAYEAEDQEAIMLVGAPTQAGLFEANLVAQLCCDGVPTLDSKTILFAISGGLFLNWFHVDPARRDMQLMLRTREVFSYAFGDEMWMKRGDNHQFNLILRDGPLPTAPPKIVITAQGQTSQVSDANYGKDTVSTVGYTEMVFALRLASDPDEIELLSVEATVEVIDGRSVFAFDFEATSDEIAQAMEKEGRRTSNPSASVALFCIGEFTWIKDGKRRSSLNFPATIIQDIKR